MWFLPADIVSNRYRGDPWSRHFCESVLLLSRPGFPFAISHVAHAADATRAFPCAIDRRRAGGSYMR
jgi:hypothetical protein